MAKLWDLPPELHQNIVRRLSKSSRLSLSVTDRYFHKLIGRVELNKAETWELRMRQEQSDSDRYSRACSKCFRFLQFYHFSRNQASAKTKPERRLCLDCFAKIGASKTGIKWFFGDIEQCQYCYRLVADDKRQWPDARGTLRNHPCVLYKQQLGSEEKEPYVSYYRGWLDRLEAKMKPRSLLCFRQGRPGLLDEPLSATLARLEASELCKFNQDGGPP